MSDNKNIVDKVFSLVSGSIKFFLLLVAFIVVAATINTCSMMGKIADGVTSNATPASPGTTGEGTATSELLATAPAVVRSAKLVKQGYQSYLEISVAISNNSPKAISGFKGYVEIYDLFNKRLKKSEFKEMTAIEPGKNFLSVQYLELNEFMSADQDIFAAPDKLKFTVMPTAIVFADGTRLGQ